MFEELRERRAVRFVIGYAVTAWLVAQVVGFFVEQGYVGRTILDVALFLIGVGFLVMLVLVWYHGEGGRQKVRRSEASLLLALLVIAGVGGTYLATRGAAPDLAVDPDDVFVDLGDRSIAVLPFENELTDPSMEWLDRGVSELIATDLSQVESLRVVGGQRIIDLLRQLGADDERVVPESHRTRVTQLAGAHYMLTGRIAGSVGNFVLIASLTDADTGEIAAGASRTGSDVFALVDEVSADLLAQSLTTTDDTPVASIADMTTANLEAYAEYQRGLEARWQVRVPEAAEHFRRATELDSTFALAHFQLAGAQAAMGDFAAAPLSLQNARKNLTLASGRDSLFIAGWGAWIEGDTGTGERILRDLIARYPDEKEGRIVLAGALRGRDGSGAEAARLIEETLRLDPLYSVGYNELAYTEAGRGNLDTAAALIATYVRLEPGLANPIDSKGEILEMAGRTEEAREAYREALTLDPSFTAALRHLFESYMREDRGADARAELAGFFEGEEAGVRAIARSLAGQAYLWDGDFDAGVASLEASVAEAESDPAFLVNQLRELLFVLIQLGRLEDGVLVADRISTLSPFEGAHEVRAIIAAGETGRIEELDRVAAAMVTRFRNDPNLATFADFAESMAGIWQAFYTGQHELVLQLAENAPFASGETGTEQLAYPVMRSLLALGQGERAIGHLDVARRAGITGIPNQWDSMTRRILQYYEGRARALSGDTAGALAAYRELVDAWGVATREVPLAADAIDRLEALEAP